jgi:hypothetical protein
MHGPVEEASRGMRESTRRRQPRHRGTVSGKKAVPEKEVLTERVKPEWYYWTGVAVTAALVVVTCVNRADAFGPSVWLANLVVLTISTASVGCVTYFRSNFASALMFGVTIIVGSLVIAGLSHVIPVVVVAYGSLWAGTLTEFLIGLILTAGERRKIRRYPRYAIPR